MSAGSALRAGQSAALRQLMTLTLAAYAPNGTTTDGNGYEVPAFTTKGSTVGYVPRRSSRGTDTPTRYLAIGGIDRPVRHGGLSIPVDSYVVDGALEITAGEERGTGWEFVVTGIGPDDDAALLGRRYLVVAVPVVSATARRLDVIEL